MSPKVSVIIPVLNSEAFLKECLDSVVAQTYRHLEIIVVDDGSTDKTPLIARHYADIDKRVIIVQSDGRGPGGARNVGLEHSTGEWIVYVDGDDVLMPRGVETLLNSAVATNCLVACGNFTRIFTPERTATKCGKESKPTSLSAEQAVVDMLHQRRISSAPWAKIFNRNLKDCLHFPADIYFEDLDIMYRVFMNAGRVAVTKQVVYFYRPNPASALGTFSPRRFDVLDVTDRIEQWASERSEVIRKAAADRSLSAAFNILGLLSANGAASLYPDVERKCLAIIRRKRRRSLFNPRVRLKNKGGILLSYLGPKVLRQILGWHYR